MKTDINTHTRLFDLVRFMRAELHQADLITDEEYAWLCMEAPMAKGQGSPSPRRLEDYDELRGKLSAMTEERIRLRRAIDQLGFRFAGVHDDLSKRCQAVLFKGETLDGLPIQPHHHV
jgi:hypothetical protein